MCKSASRGESLHTPPKKVSGQVLTNRRKWTKELRAHGKWLTQHPCSSSINSCPDSLHSHWISLPFIKSCLVNTWKVSQQLLCRLQEKAQSGFLPVLHLSTKQAPIASSLSWLEELSQTLIQLMLLTTLHYAKELAPSSKHTASTVFCTNTSLNWNGAFIYLTNCISAGFTIRTQPHADSFSIFGSPFNSWVFSAQ